MPSSSTARRCLTSRSLLALGLVVAAAAAIGASPRPDGEPLNARCPVTGEAVTEKGGTVEHDGVTIGFCCPMCSGMFKVWDEKRRDAFVENVQREIERGVEGSTSRPFAPPTSRPALAPKGDPYPLDTCIVSGEKLGSMGNPVIRVYDGREVRLCCAGCIGKFEADKRKHFDAIDKKIVASQRPAYPIDHCVVMGDGFLDDDGKDVGVDVVHQNRLVRLCCRMCIRRFDRQPERFVKRLDEAIVGKQGPVYPLDTCVVSGAKLGSMGAPYETVIANRLVRLCCQGCVDGLRKDVAKHVRTLDEAWAKAKKQ